MMNLEMKPFSTADHYFLSTFSLCISFCYLLPLSFCYLLSVFLILLSSPSLSLYKRTNLQPLFTILYHLFPTSLWSSLYVSPFFFGSSLSLSHFLPPPSLSLSLSLSLSESLISLCDISLTLCSRLHEKRLFCFEQFLTFT